MNLGKRFEESRDPDDNVLLATAAAGGARFLISNDRDLLDLADTGMAGERFRIVSPAELLDELAGKE